jgi:trehalose-6-phosphate synthase
MTPCGRLKILGGRSCIQFPVQLQHDLVTILAANPFPPAALWPLFHYLLWQDVATQYASADEHWADYEQANFAFAERIIDIYRPGDLIWVHDYHLLLVPKMIRQLVPEAVVGIFIHTPFPSSEVFRCLPSKFAYVVSDRI